MKQYDLIIIGAGSAATHAATIVREAGWQVAVIDFRPYGGTCALRGCMPKKVLRAGPVVLDAALQMRDKGVVGELDLNWKELMAFKRSFTDPVPQERERSYHEQGIDTYHGVARFAGKNQIQVNDLALDARHILIACGEEPIPLGIAGEEHLLDNESFMALEAMPRRVVLVGGGYIAAEFSQIAVQAGAQVTILQHGARLLKEFDAELVQWLMPAFSANGIEIRLHTSVEGIEKTDSGYRVHSRQGEEKTTIDADIVVHAAGRAPVFDRLDLTAGGVEIEGGKLKLNGYLQSVSNPAVYAAGDAAGVGLPLTPVATYDAKIVANNLLKGNHQQVEYSGVPSVVFTNPPLAAAGITEVEALKQGIKFFVHSQNAADWFTAKHQGAPIYGYKILVEEHSDRIIGAHLVGPQVDEVINIFALAIQHGLTAEDLRTTIFAFPTGASDIGSML